MNKTNIKFNVDKLLRELSAHNNRDYEKQDVAKSTNISRTSLYGILGNSNIRVDLPTLSKLIDFFHAEGMPVTLEQLFSVEYPSADTPNKSTN